MKRSAIIFLHAGYWILYLLLLTLFMLFLNAGGVRLSPPGQQKIFDVIRLMVSTTLLPALAAFYTFYYFLFDKYLAKKKIITLCIAGLITILLSGIIGIIGLSMFSHGKLVFNTAIEIVINVLLFMSVLSLIHGIIALVMKGFITWYGDIKIKEELLQKNFETELALVKSQLNPHFLFNTINNIDVLIEKDAGKASAYLNKLSDIMRFMLYETKTTTIALQKELTYINKYIDLQKIRTANANFVQYTADGDTGKWMVAPMLFIPFIENAFKHSGNKKNETAIVIKIFAGDKTLDFYCENYCGESHLAAHEAGGAGNSLIQKRLALLYPGKHRLEIKKENNIFKVQLTVYADEK